MKASLDHYSSLEECIGKLDVNFNNPGDIFILSTKLSKARFTKDKLCSVQGGLLGHRMQLYNKRPGSWERALCFQRFPDDAVAQGQDLRRSKLALEIMDLWKSDPTAGFLANEGAIQR